MINFRGFHGLGSIRESKSARKYLKKVIRENVKSEAEPRNLNLFEKRNILMAKFSSFYHQKRVTKNAKLFKFCESSHPQNLIPAKFYAIKVK